MIGDNADIVRRLRDVLPRGWFSDTSPVASAILSALAEAWTFSYKLIGTVTALTRISTSSGTFVDATSSDYFGGDLLRRNGESDISFIHRIKQELFRPRGTRLALATILRDLTGETPYVFEPARPSDTGGYNIGGCGYNVGGGYGNLGLSHTTFVTAYRPNGQGIADVAGYATGGPLVYGSMMMVNSPVSDLEIYNAISTVLPLGCTAWLNIK